MSDPLALWRMACRHHGVGSVRKSDPKYAAIHRDFEKAKIHGTGFFSKLVSGIKTVAAQPFVQDLAKQGVQKGLEHLAAGGGGIKRKGRKKKVVHMVEGGNIFDDLFG